MRKYIIRVVAVIALLYLGVTGWLYFNQRSLMYHPTKDVKQLAEYNLDGVEELSVQSLSGNTIQMWYRKPAEGKPVAIYLHGNCCMLGYRAAHFKALIDMGYGFVAPSYSGFGQSEGAPSMDAILGDAKTAIEFAKKQGYEPQNMIIIGESLGSGVALTMGNEYQFGGVFLITPYTSIAQRAQEIYWYLPIKWLVKDNFVSTDKIGTINAPVLLVHGTVDTIIPLHHSQELMTLAQEPKNLIIYEGKGHSDLDIKEIFLQMDKYLGDMRKIEVSEACE